MADTPPKSDSSRSDREKRLAEALRANLRRRKAGRAPAPKGATGAEDSDS